LSASRKQHYISNFPIIQGQRRHTSIELIYENKVKAIPPKVS
jgi:hypothetical protein